MLQAVHFVECSVDDSIFMVVEPQAADDPIKAAQQEIKDLEEILPDIRGKVRMHCQVLTSDK